MKLSAFARELRFLTKQPFVMAMFAIATVLSAFSVWSGINEVDQQHQTIDRLLIADAADRKAAIAKESDYGGAAYGIFHMTYDPPSDLAFAALGERNVSPWKHRIRMLALEGQIYESDTANAELAQLGQFDFAFVISVLVPIFLIMLLHDIRASERVAGRYDLLAATVGNSAVLWRTRAAVRILPLGAGVILPFLIGAIVSSADMIPVIGVSIVATLSILFWSILCLIASARAYSGPTIASGLIAIWVLTTFVIPSASDALIESIVPAPEGGYIILAQRETVNDAWDLPKTATMDAFVKEHPEWADYADITRPFEWKWYYAFQQVGDQSVSTISAERRGAIMLRDTVAGWFAIFSPASLTDRALMSLADTDVKAAMRYQQRVRDYHATLRSYYYPLLFKDADYDADILTKLPRYDAKSNPANPTGMIK